MINPFPKFSLNIGNSPVPDILSYEYERDDYYCYPNSSVLINLLNIKNEKELAKAEREITSLRTAKLIQEPLKGELDFNYIKHLHQNLFTGIYQWAGEIRHIDISKGNIFCQHELIEVNANALLAELKSENFLKCQPQDIIVKRLAYYLGDLNTIHPFREGNGRVQRIFIREVASRAGYTVNFNQISQTEMIKASDAAFHHEYSLLEEIIARSISPK